LLALEFSHRCNPVAFLLIQADVVLRLLFLI